MGHKAISDLEKGNSKMKAHAGAETHIRYVEAKPLAKKGESITHHLQHWASREKHEPKCLSSQFISAVLISYPNSTLLTRQTSISLSTSSFLVLEKIYKSLSVEQQRMHLDISSDAIIDFVEAIRVWVDWVASKSASGWWVYWLIFQM